MNALTTIKTSMIIMGILIVAAFALIANKVTEKNQTSKVKSDKVPNEITLSVTEEISQIITCGTYVCVLITGEARTSKLLTLDPRKGHVINTVEFVKKD